MVDYPQEFWDEFDKDWPSLKKSVPHNRSPLSGPIGSLDRNGKWSFSRPIPKKMSPAQWAEFNCQVYTCRSIIWEYAPDGRRLSISEEELISNFMKIHFIGDNSLDHRFASCLCCWKTRLRKFNDAEVTPYPSSCAIDDPRLPRLGRCGCTVCNSCILAMEHKLGELAEYPCPNCGNRRCFTKFVKVWSVSHEVVKKHLSNLQQQGQQQFFDISNSNLKTMH